MSASRGLRGAGPGVGLPDGASFDPAWQPGEDMKLGEGMLLNLICLGKTTPSFSIDGLETELARCSETTTEFIEGVVEYMKIAKIRRSESDVIRRLVSLREAYGEENSGFALFRKEAQTAHDATHRKSAQPGTTTPAARAGPPGHPISASMSGSLSSRPSVAAATRNTRARSPASSCASSAHSGARSSAIDRVVSASQRGDSHVLIVPGRCATPGCTLQDNHLGPHNGEAVRCVRPSPARSPGIMANHGAGATPAGSAGPPTSSKRKTPPPPSPLAPSSASSAASAPSSASKRVGVLSIQGVLERKKAKLLSSAERKTYTEIFGTASRYHLLHALLLLCTPFARFPMATTGLRIPPRREARAKIPN